MSFIENKFCNMLYGFAKGKNLSVQEDMLCAADFSTGKSICQVSKALSVSPAVLRASVSLGRGCVASALFVEPLGLPVSSSMRLPGLHPLAVSPRPAPLPKSLHMKASAASILEAYIKVFIEV